VDPSEVIDTAGAVVAVTAAVGILLLLPLYLSQRRDLSRLMELMQNDPEHPVADLRASEAILDRAETELEELLGTAAPAAAPEPTEVHPAPEAPPPGTPVEGVSVEGLTVAQRVTGERPALERITMERAALEPHPRWRRFATRATQPRALIAMAIAAVVIGVGAIFGSELLLEEGDRRPATKAGAIDPAQVNVAVLNGTSVGGLGAKVGDDVEANGFNLGAVTTSSEPFAQTVVMFEDGHQREARRVARDLGVDPVQPIDRAAQRVADGAEVVVIAGDDRASA
jgi:LytR cell envelope-related transcriptional attenuator